jgi:hypothetical protein
MSIVSLVIAPYISEGPPEAPDTETNVRTQPKTEITLKAAEPRK